MTSFRKHGFTLVEVPLDFDSPTHPQGPDYDIGAFGYPATDSIRPTPPRSLRLN